MPKEDGAFSGPLVHHCELSDDVEEDILKRMIDSGICIDLRRQLCSLTMVNKHHPQTKLYFQSDVSCRREATKHLVNHINMLHPFSIWALYWEFFIFWIYLYLGVVCSISVAFFNDPVLIYRMNLARFAGDFVLFIDMIQIFFKGYYSAEKSRTVMKPSEVAQNYFKTYFFVDLIASLPSCCLLLKWFSNIEFSIIVLRILSLLSSLRICRIGRWLEAIELYRQYMSYSSYWFMAFKAVLTYLALILTSYVIVFTIMTSTFSHPSESRYLNKMEYFYKATLILLIVTHGDHTLNTTANIALISFFLCFGYVMQLFLYAKIMQVWKKFLSASSDNNNLLQQFKEYMIYKGLPLRIRRKIFTYFNFKFQNEFFNEAQINSMVSDILKQEILLHVTKKHIEKVHFFKGIPPEIFLKIVSQLKSEIYLPDDVIVTAGVPGTCMYFIYFGTVAVYSNMGKELCHLEDGAHFGEIALVFNEPRIATVVAVTPCELFKLKRTDFLNVMEPYTELKAQIVANARDRLLSYRLESF